MMTTPGGPDEKVPENENIPPIPGLRLIVDDFKNILYSVGQTKVECLHGSYRSLCDKLDEVVAGVEFLVRPHEFNQCTQLHVQRAPNFIVQANAANIANIAINVAPRAQPQQQRPQQAVLSQHHQSVPPGLGTNATNNQLGNTANSQNRNDQQANTNNNIQRNNNKQSYPRQLPFRNPNLREQQAENQQHHDPQQQRDHHQQNNNQQMQKTQTSTTTTTSEKDACSICLEAIDPLETTEQKQAYKTNICCHPFHRGCIRTMQRKHGDSRYGCYPCPLCRLPLNDFATTQQLREQEHGFGFPAGDQQPADTTAGNTAASDAMNNTQRIGSLLANASRANRSNRSRRSGGRRTTRAGSNNANRGSRGNRSNQRRNTDSTVSAYDTNAAALQQSGIHALPTVLRLAWNNIKEVDRITIWRKETEFELAESIKEAQRNRASTAYISQLQKVLQGLDNALPDTAWVPKADSIRHYLDQHAASPSKASQDTSPSHPRADDIQQEQQRDQSRTLGSAATGGRDLTLSRFGTPQTPRQQRQQPPPNPSYHTPSQLSNDQHASRYTSPQQQEDYYGRYTEEQRRAYGYGYQHEDWLRRTYNDHNAIRGRSNFARMPSKWPWNTDADRELGDDGVQLWTANRNPYEPLNCFQNVYDGHGIFIGLEDGSDGLEGLHYVGDRLYQLRRDNIILAWTILRYPEQWFLAVQDWPNRKKRLDFYRKQQRRGILPIEYASPPQSTQQGATYQATDQQQNTYQSAPTYHGQHAAKQQSTNYHQKQPTVSTSDAIPSTYAKPQNPPQNKPKPSSSRTTASTTTQRRPPLIATNSFEAPSQIIDVNGNTPSSSSGISAEQQVNSQNVGHHEATRDATQQTANMDETMKQQLKELDDEKEKEYKKEKESRNDNNQNGKRKTRRGSRGSKKNKTNYNSDGTEYTEHQQRKQQH